MQLEGMAVRAYFPFLYPAFFSVSVAWQLWMHLVHRNWALPWLVANNVLFHFCPQKKILKVTFVTRLEVWSMLEHSSSMHKNPWLFIIAILTGMSWHSLIILICISLIIRDMKSCYLLFCCWVVEFICVLGISLEELSRWIICKYFSYLAVCLYLFIFFPKQKPLSLWEFHLYAVTFVAFTFDLFFRKSLHLI